MERLQLDGSCFGPDGTTGYCVGRFCREPGGVARFVAEGFLLWGDAQSVLSRCVDAEVALEKGLVRAVEYAGRPDAVELAFEYVRHCNSLQAPIVVHDRLPDGGVATDVYDAPQLHHKQEAALAQACQLIGEYFSLGLVEIRDVGDGEVVE